MNTKNLWTRPTGSGGHYFATPEDLDAAMEGDPFYDKNVPLSGVIFTNQPEKPDPFEQAEVENPGADFRKFLQETEDEKLAQAHTFYAGEWRVQIRYKAGKWICNASNQDSSETKSFTLANVGSDRDSAMVGAGNYLKKFAPLWRELSEGHLDTLSRIASEGTAMAMQNAAVEYVCCSLNKRPQELDNSNILNDPRYLPLLNDAAWFAFVHGKPDVTDAAQRWMSEQLGRRAITINSLFAVYELWQDHKLKREKGRLFAGTALAEQPEPSADEVVEQLDSLSDESLEALRIRTAQFNARRK